MNTLKHSCGIVGIYSDREINMPEQLFYPLFSLQHRGQESCGISYTKEKRHVTYRDTGMVGQVLSHYLGEDHPSRIGIGHVRYSTQGINRLENAQPISIHCNKGNVSLAHNGNISNSTTVRQRLFGDGSIFQSTTDSELILHLIARSHKRDFSDVLIETLLMLEGAFNLLLIHENRLVAVRDPNGFRPLVIGEQNGMVAICSETCALDILRITNRREVKPGEIIIVDENGVRSIVYQDENRISKCIFELIYFARPDSNIFDHSVHVTRGIMGEFLAKNDDQAADIVTPVPDSGNSAAYGYSRASQIPFEMGLARNHYAGRTFIQPTTNQREFGVRMKLHPIKEIIEGKRLIVIDDSLVRGTTSRIIVKLLREKGAAEIHFRLSSPEIRYPCYFGIDIPTKNELISHTKTPPEIAAFIGADSVRFLPLESLGQSVKEKDNFCFACFNGDYPVKVRNSEQE